MSNASRDENSVPTLIAASSADGSTIVPIQVDATTHTLSTSDGATGSDLGPTNAPRDGNTVPALMGISSTDGVTPVVIYADAATGALLTKST